MENTNNIQNKITDDILNIDFSGCENIVSFSNLVDKINENEKNIIYKDSIDFLYHFYNYNPNYFEYKYNDFILKEEVLEQLNNIVYDVKNPLLQLKIATCLLIEYKNIKNKPEIARLIIKNTILFFNKLFLKDSYGLEEGVLFALNVNCIFELEKEYKYMEKLKEAINNYLHSKEYENIDFAFIKLFENLIKRYKNFYTKDELKVIELKLYEIIEIKLKHINEINQDNYLLLNSDIVCGLYENLHLIDKNNEKDNCQKIVNMFLLIFSKIKSSDMKMGILDSALKYAQKIKNKKQISKINSLIQENNKKITFKFKPICFNIPKEYQEAIKRFENDVDIFLNSNFNLFQCFCGIYPYLKTNFKKIEEKNSIVDLLSCVMYFDSDNLRENIDNSGLFRKYYNYIAISYPLIDILKSKLLQRFYPNKEYFYYLTCDNNIIPKGYEEIIARMFCAGIHKDYMDFFIYASVSIEAILRHIIGEDIIKNDKKNHQIQEYETLENLLDKIESQNLLEEDTVKELRLLFCKDGFNIRNKIAHARFSQDIFNEHYMLADYMWCFLMNFFIGNYYYNKNLR